MDENIIELFAHEVQEGDFIPGLDNGFVIAAERHAWLAIPALSDGYNVDLGEHVAITFHDLNGEEGYLIVKPESPVIVRRGGAI